MKSCSIDQCENWSESRGLCHNHYQQWRRKNADVCVIDDCNNLGTRRSMCRRHYYEWRKDNGDSCSIDGCNKVINCRKLCREHYEQWRIENAPRCSAEGCNNHRVAHNLCNKHFKKYQKSRAEKCTVDNCSELQDSRGLCRKHYYYFMKYGLTEDLHQELKNIQENKCAICGSKPDKGTTTNSNELHIDHDHETNEVRGLLCHFCNVGLGQFKDNEQLLFAAIQYLRQPPASTFVHSISEALNEV